MIKLRDTNEGHGFTLVELLIVVVILGILAGIVVFAVGNLTDNASSTSCDAELESIDRAVQATLAENPSLTMSDLDAFTDIQANLSETPTSFTLSGGKATGVGDCAGHDSG